MITLENQQGDRERETQDHSAERPLGALDPSCGSLELELCWPSSPIELELDVAEMLGQDWIAENEEHDEEEKVF